MAKEIKKPKKPDEPDLLPAMGYRVPKNSKER